MENKKKMHTLKYSLFCHCCLCYMNCTSVELHEKDARTEVPFEVYLILHNRQVIIGFRF